MIMYVALHMMVKNVILGYRDLISLKEKPHITEA